MIRELLDRYGFMLCRQDSDSECIVFDVSASAYKTMSVIDGSDPMRLAAGSIRSRPSFCLERIERIEKADTLSGALVIISPDAGDVPSKYTAQDAYSAICAAMILKEYGAAHSDLISSVRHIGQESRICGLGKLVPFSREAEAEELRQVLRLAGMTGCDMGGVDTSDAESIRERLSNISKRWMKASISAPAAESIRKSLLDIPEFKSAWSRLDYINSGAYGYVYRAEEAGTGDLYALKIIDTSGSTARLRDAMREYLEASQFCSSKYIAKTYDYGEYRVGGANMVWIKMELLEPIPSEISDERTVASIGRDICCALETVHGEGKAHRDVKPANILRGRDCWKLCDFGITKTVQARRQATVVGTADFMTPELLSAAARNIDRITYDNTVDTYALGATMYTLLNRGTTPFLVLPPFSSSEDDIRSANLRRRRGDMFDDAVNCGPRLMRIIRKACAPSIKDRFRDASEMADALEDLLDE